MKKTPGYLAACLFLIFTVFDSDAQWKVNDMSRPLPPVVTTGNNGIPSDAEILFNGTDISKWRNVNGTEASWKIIDSCLVAAKAWNDIRTLRNYGDCQLHLEFMISVPVHGENNMRGNSGVVLMGKYEVQIMDSYRFETFPDGQNAAIYGQSPPLVNASLPPDQWQTFDIFFKSPGFDDKGKLTSPAKITMLHNGFLVHHDLELAGQSSWLGKLRYEKHPRKLPVVLQSHVQPVRFRNIWIRDLGSLNVNPYTKKEVYEITLPEDQMAEYDGIYDWTDSLQPAVIRDKRNYLEAFLPGKAERDLIAYDKDRFYAEGIDLWFEFIRDNAGKVFKMNMNNGGKIVEFQKKQPR